MDTNETRKEFEIPVDGSLGLLALGDVGIMAWREARQKAGINIIEIRKKEYDERMAEFEKKKAEFEAKKKEKEDKKKEEDNNKNGQENS